MSEAFLNQVTLDCLLNKHQYEKYVSQKISKSLDEKEVNFYKNRIINLTSDFLDEEKEKPTLLPDVKYAFDNYVKACIHSFKVVDNNDIIQSEYNSIVKCENETDSSVDDLAIDTVNETTKNEDELSEERLDEVDKEEVDEIKEKINTNFVRSTIKIINPTLDNFIKFKEQNVNNNIILPKRKDMNLK